jgi:hypothetical protein
VLAGRPESSQVSHCTTACAIAYASKVANAVVIVSSLPFAIENTLFMGGHPLQSARVELASLLEQYSI